MKLFWKTSNIAAIVISVILAIINYSASDGNIETRLTIIESFSENAGLIIFAINIFLIGPVSFVTLIIKKELTWKIFLTNFALGLVHITISIYFIINVLGRAFF